MSDANLLAGAPLEWAHAGKDYNLACPDIELELLFQAAHERWATSRLEALAGGVSEAAHAAAMAAHVENLSANRFAFLGRLSLAFIGSDRGACEYLALLMAKGKKEKGGPVMSPRQLLDLARSDRAAFDALVGPVYRRDFPNFLAPEAPGQETPPPSTGASS